MPASWPCCGTFKPIPTVALASAINAYEAGMRADLNDYYPSSNLPSLLRARGRSSDIERARFIGALVVEQIERSLSENGRDEWARPTLLGAAFYVGWNIGANDAANCIGTTVGARVLPFRTAALIMAFFVILGGALQGHHVMKTVGKGIVITDAAVYETHNGRPAPEEHVAYFPENRLPDRAIFVALLSAGLFVTRSWSSYTLNVVADHNETFFGDTNSVVRRRLPEVVRRLGTDPLLLVVDPGLMATDSPGAVKAFWYVPTETRDGAILTPVFVSVKEL